MVELGSHWDSEEEFLSKFIMFPKTKNIDELLVFQNLGYGLYFEYNKELIRIGIYSSDYVSKLPWSLQSFIRRATINIHDIYTTNIDKVNSFIDIRRPFYIKKYYLIHD